MTDMEESPEGHIYSEEDWAEFRESWSKWLHEWEANLYYPLFSKMGYSKGVAMQFYINNQLKNIVSNIEDLLKEKLDYGGSPKKEG